MFRPYSLLFVACATSATLAADAPATHVALPDIGITFDAPAGWRRLPEKGERELARFAHLVGGKLVGSAIVELVGGKAGAIKAIADQAVASEKGQVIVATPPLPGDAIELRLPAQPQVPLAANVVAVAVAGRDALLVTSLANDEADASAALRSILASVVVADARPASDGLTSPGVAFTLFDSQVTVTLPEPFRPGKKANGGTQLFYGVHDRVSGKDECSAIIQQMPNPKGLPIQEIARASAAALTAKFKLATPMTATHANDVPAAMVSSAFDDATGTPTTERIVWARLDGQHYAMLIFGVTAADPAAHDRYVALAESVAKDLRIGKPFASTRPAAPTKP